MQKKKPVKTGHEIVNALIKEGYSLAQLAEFYEISTAVICKMAQRADYQESDERRKILNTKRPKERPRWAEKMARLNQ